MMAVGPVLSVHLDPLHLFDMCVCVCVCVCVCMCIMHACMYVCMCVCMFAVHVGMGRGGGQEELTIIGAQLPSGTSKNISVLLLVTKDTVWQRGEVWKNRQGSH